VSFNETENGRRLVARRLSSLLVFNIQWEDRTERTLDRAEKTDQTDESRESAFGEVRRYEMLWWILDMNDWKWERFAST
jgi:hypothetical protein